MASEPHIPDDLVERARVIRREYGGPPVIDDLVDEIERLRDSISNMHPGFDVDEAISLFGGGSDVGG